MFDFTRSRPTPLGKTSAAASLLAHAAAVFLLFLVGGPITHFVAQPRSIALIAPIPPIASMRPPRHNIQHPVPPRRAARPSMAPPTPAKLRRLQIEIPKAPTLPSVTPLSPIPDLPRVTAAPPRSPVKMGEFARTIASPPEFAPQLPVQAAGFSSAENSVSALARARPGTATSGFDAAGVAEVSKRGVLSASGFSSPLQGSNSSQAQQPVAKGSFSDAATATPSAPLKQIRSASLASPVEILSKPRPVYTAEARGLGVEGEVLVEVVFEATGGVRVLRLIKGLGHGLDENALAAAREIRFRPARREGVPEDSTAVVHILFQLAY